MLYLFSLCLATLFVFFPSAAHAWGPIAHLHFAQTVLSQSAALPQLVRNIITSFPNDFLYGALAADITIAKRFVEYIHNCHNWDVGLKILKGAQTKESQAFSYGYLCHLGVDTVSHNYFVPFQLVAHFRTRVLRHIYWEMRYDTALHMPELAKFARDIVKKRRYSHHDHYLDSVLKRTLFSFKVNRTLFSGLILLHDLNHWQKTTQQIMKKSKWELPQSEVKELKDLAVKNALDFLSGFEESHAYTKDPSGYHALSTAKKLRRALKRKHRFGGLSEKDIPKELSLVKTNFKTKLLE